MACSASPKGCRPEYGEGRVIDTPLNESGIVGTAVGMALAGARPVAEIQFEGFVYPAFDQIVSHLGRFRYRTRGNSSVPVVVRFPSGAGIGAHEHHCDSPEAYFVHAPGLVVICPSTPTDAKGPPGRGSRRRRPGDLPRAQGPLPGGAGGCPGRAFHPPIGRARIRGRAPTSPWSPTAGWCRSPWRPRRGSEASVEVIDLRTLFPWDRETVLDSVAKTGRLLLVQEPQGSAGVAAEVAAVVAEKALYDLQGPIVQQSPGSMSPGPSSPSRNTP